MNWWQSSSQISFGLGTSLQRRATSAHVSLRVSFCRWLVRSQGPNIPSAALFLFLLYCLLTSDEFLILQLLLINRFRSERRRFLNYAILLIRRWDLDG